MRNKIILFSLALACWFLTYTSVSFATDTVPRTINYQGRLLDNSRQPIQTAQTIRFSLWSTSDFNSTDLNAGGAINTSAWNYSNWQEEQTFTPDSYGVFSVQIGQINPLPDMDYNLHKFLQVEIKPNSSSVTAYEILDPTGNLADSNDRKPLNSAFYALNADKLDNTEIGTGSGDLAKLGPNGQWGINFIPAGTNHDSFTLDFDDTNSNAISLNFWQTLNKVLKFDVLNNWFSFNADVLIEWLLKLTGNQISLNSNPSGDLDVFIIANQTSGSGGVIKYNATEKEWQLSNDGNNFETILTNVALDWDNFSTRKKTMTLIPEYQGVTMYGDGTNNSGTMFADYEDNGGSDKHNFYIWTSRKEILQDYDLTLRIQLPLDFVSFDTTPFNLNYKTFDTNWSNNKIDFSLENEAGTAVILNGSTNLISTSSDTWNSVNLSFVGSPSFSAGEYITLRLKLSTNNLGAASVGEINLNYIGK